MEVWAATTNTGKIKEFEAIFRDVAVVKSIHDMPNYTPPDENGDSFEANAEVKAKYLKVMKEGVWVFADDSGLECEGLDGMPGIHSARYAGPTANDIQNTAKLLKFLAMRTQNRNAKFVCCIVAFDPDGNKHVFSGSMKGTIAKNMRGTTGFGYDPIFIPEGMEKTLAELGPGEKNQISHRFKAAQMFLNHIKN